MSGVLGTKVEACCMQVDLCSVNLTNMGPTKAVLRQGVTAINILHNGLIIIGGGDGSIYAVDTQPILLNGVTSSASMKARPIGHVHGCPSSITVKESFDITGDVCLIVGTCNSTIYKFTSTVEVGQISTSLSTAVQSKCHA